MKKIISFGLLLMLVHINVIAFEQGVYRCGDATYWLKDNMNVKATAYGITQRGIWEDDDDIATIKLKQNNGTYQRMSISLGGLFPCKKLKQDTLETDNSSVETMMKGLFGKKE